MNLKIDSIYIEGFQSIGSIQASLDNLGTVLIKGENQYESKSESNGSGKSSVAEAILWCLYGQTSAGVSAPVNKFTSTGCLVTLKLSVGDEEYEVTRTSDHHIRKNSLTIIQKGTDISGRNKSDSEKILQDILPMTEDVFLSTVFLSQGFAAKLSSLSPSARKARLEEITQTGYQLEHLKNKLSEQKSKYSQCHYDHSHSVADITGQLTILTSEVKRLEDDIDTYLNMNEPGINLKEYRDKLANIQSRILDLTEKKSELSKNIMNIKVNSDQASRAIHDCKLRLPEIENMLNSLHKNICPTCGQHYESEESVQLTKDLTSEKELILAELDTKTRAMDGFAADMKSLNDELSKTNQLIDKFKSVSASLSQEIEANPEKPKRDIESEKQTIKNHKSKIESLQLKKAEDEKHLMQLDTSIGAIDHMLYLISRQFRGYLLSNAVAFMNQKLSEYSNELFSGDLIQLSDDTNKLDIYLGDMKYESLSGGEKRKVDLAVTLAQRDLSASVSNTSSNMIILDETLEHLDEVATNTALSLISSVAEEVSSVFIISHNNYAIPYDSIWTIVKDPNRVSSLSI